MSDEDIRKHNEELWAALRLLLVERDKVRTEVRTAELAALRAAEFQRQVLALAPSLINMLAGRDIVPSEEALLDALAAGSTPEQRGVLFRSVRSLQKGECLEAILRSHFDTYDKKRDAARAEEERLMREAKGTYDAGEKDAAGEPTWKPVDISHEDMQKTLEEIQKPPAQKNYTFGSSALPTSVDVKGCTISFEACMRLFDMVRRHQNTLMQALEQRDRRIEELTKQSEELFKGLRDVLAERAVKKEST